MINVIRSEVFKLRTIRLHVWLPFGAVILLIVVVGLVALLNDDPERFSTVDLMNLIGVFSVLVSMMVGVIASLGITSDFGYNTIRPTIAATPNRTVVFVAKAIVSVVFGFLVGLITVISAYAVGNVLLSSRDAAIGLSGDDGTMAAFLGVPILAALLGLFGFGLGLLLRNSPAAVSLIILWPLLIENILGAVLNGVGVDDAGKYLPYSSAFALVVPDVDEFGNGRISGGVFFGLVALAITAVGIAVNNRRDV